MELREIYQGQANEIQELERERDRLRRWLRDTKREWDQAIQCYIEAEIALRAGR